MHAPPTLYKSDISYFSGKLEAYLRYRGIDYRAVDASAQTLRDIGRVTGISKMPALELADGRWLFDTTPSIAWLEQSARGASITPDDPALAFFALLLEDYADEWLWRPAMWWRWVPIVSRRAVGYRIASEMITRRGARIAGWYFGRRQLREWVWGDGVNRANSDAVRDMLLREFELLEPLLQSRPFLLGSHPSIADFGYFGPMFRHFGNDPDPAEVMRRLAPNTYEWVARLWNAHQHDLPEQPQWRWPEEDYWRPLLRRIARDYLPYLHQNALAHRRGAPRFDFVGDSLQFPGTRTTTYRVWCREQLQSAWFTLEDGQRQRLQSLFGEHGGLGALEADGTISSGLSDTFQLPLEPAPSKHVLPWRVRIFGQPRN